MRKPLVIVLFLSVVGIVPRATQAADGDGKASPEARERTATERLDARLAALEEENRRMRERVAELERAAKQNEATREKVAKLEDDATFFDQQITRLLPLVSKLGGYLDFGFFRATGTGAGIRSDTGYRYFPEYEGDIPASWVFYGDPLSTMVNARGEPADTGESRALTFDAIDSGGKSSFAVNALNMQLFAAPREDLTLTASIDFVPRARDVSAPGDRALGDFIDVKLAYAEYLVPIERFELSLYAGKFDSVLGWEYRSREAPDRLTVTPSLLCRYTCGSPLGLKARGKFWDGAMILNVAVTNGSHGSENFPFHGEIDRNDWKTVAGRIASRAPLGAGLEVGLSGSIGAQDLQNAEDALHKHVGVDLHLDWHDFDVTAEVMHGLFAGKSAPGDTKCGLAPCLRYRGGYLQVGYRVLNWLTPYARVDARDAIHRSGASFVYLSQVLRATAGVRMELGPHLILKAEYNLNRELGRAPQFPNDVFTSSMLLKY
ncbi:hypothetical protein [Polyangium sp. 6x1]|uniref:hypothetical protein n=1 Tax=Polyangium sp. 6x1 TaxID=3042689 RepID=UPI002482E1F8|nr:hypothetical protein [Polyangium sp. 6x1]MDI1448688.1 hypothetical protein [Polyangium sp. 6x1]